MFLKVFYSGIKVAFKYLLLEINITGVLSSLNSSKLIDFRQAHYKIELIKGLDRALFVNNPLKGEQKV
jgi:hypothetical protein